MPPTGIVLPFISYGGNALMIFMASVGILLNISKKSSL
jgi:cell division protein FtsW